MLLRLPPRSTLSQGQAWGFAPASVPSCAAVSHATTRSSTGPTQWSRPFRRYDRRVAAEPVEDVRWTRPYILSPTPLKTFGRRLASVAALAAIDIGGLVIGLYAALALRSAIVDPKPILWGLLWDHE